jgi:hypothetical protein
VNYGAWTESSWNLLKIAPSETTADGLELYFYANRQRRPEGYGGYDIYMKKREKLEDDWGPAMNLGPAVNGPYDEALPTIAPNGLELYFSGWNRDARPGGYGRADLWVTRRTTREEDWGTPENLGEAVNTDAFDARPKLLGDGLLLFFESDRPGGFGSVDLYYMRRATIADAWSAPINLGPQVNGSSSDEQGFLSPDGSTIYFHSDRPGGYGDYDIWQTSVLPIVDLNGDGHVDGRDILLMTDAWGTDMSLCDIGPSPWGDGIVDIEDVKVLAPCIGQDLVDPTLVAHWALDEAEGLIARNSAGGFDGLLVGTPTWMPTGGRIGGAVECDGDDAVMTRLQLDPSAGAFSVLAWIQGGGPGQAIVSQQAGQNWLMLDPADGTLRTELTSSTRGGSPLTSGAGIADGLWHRIALVWDGTNRRLYVDAALVAEDTQDGLKASSSPLLLGCGHDMSASTFWTGRIDDVRVYNRVVRP